MVIYMKHLIAALVIVTVFIAGGAVNDRLLQKYTGEIKGKIDSVERSAGINDWDKAADACQSAGELFVSRQGFMMCILHHDKIAHIETSVARIRSYTNNKDTVLLMAEASALSTYLDDLSRIDKLTLVNIL